MLPGAAVTIFSLLCLTSAGTAIADTIRGAAIVIDGDTIEVRTERIRLHGIDAPEYEQTCENAQGRQYACGEKATEALKSLIAGREVQCTPKDVDSYGRVIAACFIAGVNRSLNAQMVARGAALAYRRFSSDYSREEDFARTHALGIWQGAFVKPWHWRRGERLRRW